MEHTDADDRVFYREWEGRGQGERRSVPRAGLLAAELGLRPDVPVLTVVGSKGKGTAAAYASAALAASGLLVCTVTSPAYRSDRERIRLGGAAVSEAGLASLAAELAAGLDRLPPPSGGYVSPAGMFLLAGVLHGIRAGAGALVLEAGMGGRSDEVSLFPPDVLAIGRIFAEHVGVLGDTPEEIAVEKAGAAAPATRAVVSVAQEPGVRAALEAAVPKAEFLPEPPEPGFRAVGAALGGAAAARLLGSAPPAGWAAGVRLPGRQSWHRLPGTGTEVLADSAIDGPGVAAALAAARSRWTSVDRVLLCLPDHKDIPGAVAAIGELPVTFVRLPLPHLRFTRPLPAHWTVIDADDLTPGKLAGFGAHLVAVGTVYFTGRILDLLDAPTERIFDFPGAR